jgi:hypothetical protein
VVVTTAGGERVAAVPLPLAGVFTLEYRHSVYAAPVVESFEAAADGSFALVAVSSPSEAVIDYYALEGTRSQAGGWWHERLARPARFDELRVAGTAVGQRTLAACGRQVPLFAPGAAARHVALRVETGQGPGRTSPAS